REGAQHNDPYYIVETIEDNGTTSSLVPPNAEQQPKVGWDIKAILARGERPLDLTGPVVKKFLKSETYLRATGAYIDSVNCATYVHELASPDTMASAASTQYNNSSLTAASVI